MHREELIVLRDPARGRGAVPGAAQLAQALNPDGASRSILLTSAVQHEGKTVAAINLALAMVEVPNLRVVLVDGDRMHPRSEEYVGHPRPPGSDRAARGTDSLDQAIRSTSVDRLDLVGAGASTLNPGLDLERFQALLNALKRRYDYVLLDVPPSCPTNHPSLVGSIVDGILLVVRIRQDAQGARGGGYQMLEGLGGTCSAPARPRLDDPFAWGSVEEQALQERGALRCARTGARPSVSPSAPSGSAPRGARPATRAPAAVPG
jgi:Mrp family chromosome partitioning ATPase